ncbi:hypothetical protein E8A74_10570 [Polyangium fumosum]|uniref:Type IV secretion protein Rhs n=2 Tax=Polyangium fumosum TaxID=889272 RepID=A0A4U1JG24_9BACT|nr:hypothetical protein E8A74_10570 [Polyangium fumosum]
MASRRSGACRVGQKRRERSAESSASTGAGTERNGWSAWRSRWRRWARVRRIRRRWRRTMLVATQFDPVLGLDFHMVGVPAPPAPAPVPTLVPMPYVGMVFDPVGVAVSAAIGMAAGAGPGLVFVNGMPVANTGTLGTNLLTMPHVSAPGVTFLPPTGPGNDAELMFGSLGVTFGGSLAVRLGDLALSCSDPVRMPTSVVLAVPKGAPVLVNRPMVPDMKAIAFAVGIKATLRALGAVVRAGGKLFRKLRAAQRRSGKWGRISQGLRRAVDHIAPRRYRDRIHTAICFATGHPVDVATGRMFTEKRDLELPGPLPLVIERIYASSRSWRDGPLGYGWSHSLDQAVWCERGKVVYLAEDGREIEFLLGHLPDRMIRPGQSVYEPTNRLTLKARRGHRFEIETRDGLVLHFARVKGAAEPTRARLQRIGTKDGISIECEYDERGRLSRVTDSGGRKLRLGYDGNNRLREIKVPHPREGWMRHVKYEFDERGHLARVVDALGNAETYTYKGHLLVKETDRTGLSFYFQYDGLNEYAKCVRTWGDGGIYDHVIRYDERNRKTFVDDSLSNLRVFQRDELGNVVEVTNQQGKVTRYRYDPESGQESGEVDPLGREIRREFDARGNCAAIVRPDGATERMEYDRDRLVRYVNPCGAEWRWRYDGAGRLRAAINPLVEETRYRWKRGLLREVVDPMGGRVAIEYDDAKNVRSIRYPNGGEEKLVHDILGRVVEHHDARGGVTRYRHDALRLVEVEEPDGNHRRLKYDPEGNPIEAKDHARHVRFGYTGFHHLALREEAGEAVRLRYDTEGQRMSIENEAGEIHTLTRDACGRVIQEIGFDGSCQRYVYDAGGVLVKSMQASGRAVVFERDVLGRVTCVRYPDGTAERFAYRADGALIEAENDAARVTFERDALGRVVRELQGPHVVEKRYDARGLVAEVSSSLGFDGAFMRDAVGEFDAISIGTGVDRWRTSITRDAAGLEAERRLPGGIAVRTRRDRIGRVAETSMLDGGEELRRVAYTWEPGSLLKERDDSRRGLTRYFHDRRARLTAATEPEGRVRWRRPTATGNIQQAMEGEPQTYKKGGALVAADGVTYEYDRDGNRTAKVWPDGRREKYAWNAAGRLVAVTKPDGSVVKFHYDALGRRVKKTSDSEERTWIWDGDVPLHELSTREGPIAWVFEPGTFTLAAKVQGLRRWAIVTDQVGAPCAVFDEWGGVAWQGEVDVYGKAAAEGEKTAVPWRFPGQYEDVETGLYYNRFRYYDPEMGAYISKDPIGLLGGLSPYSYVQDPWAQSDPLGLSCRIKKGKPENFKAHYIDHKHLLERALGMKFPKYSKSPDGKEFLEALDNAIQDGTLRHRGLGTLNKTAPPTHFYEGKGLVAIFHTEGTWLSLMDAGTGRATQGTLRFVTPQQLMLPGFTPW